MQNVTLSAIGVETSELGMGCASLGSRVSQTQGMAALARAWEGGVRWFDVAPAYGAGEAELHLGRFLKTRPDAHICTKVGLLPPRQTPAKRLLRRVLRPAVGALAPLRAAIRKSGATANHRVELTPDLLRSSLERSLQRLGVEQVTLYALHNAAPQDLAREEILRVLEDLKSSGKVRAFGVAGSADAAQATDAPFSAVQLAHPQETAPITGPRSKGLDVITHSVFGVAGELAALTDKLRHDKALRELLGSAGLEPVAGQEKSLAARLLLDRARAANAGGVVLCSMFSERSLAQNLATAERPPAILPFAF